MLPRQRRRIVEVDRGRVDGAVSGGLTQSVGRRGEEDADARARSHGEGWGVDAVDGAGRRV